MVTEIAEDLFTLLISLVTKNTLLANKLVSSLKYKLEIKAKVNFIFSLFYSDSKWTKKYHSITLSFYYLHRGTIFYLWNLQLLTIKLDKTFDLARGLFTIQIHLLTLSFWWQLHYTVSISFSKTYSEHLRIKQLNCNFYNHG